MDGARQGYSPVTLTLLLAPLQALAQTPIISSTAAWSSQIVAFWGAVGLGARLSSPQKISNPFTALVAFSRSLRRTWQITEALKRNSWMFLPPGLMGGSVRVHVILISWNTPSQLFRLALRVALLAETVAVQKWAIVVIGRRLRSPKLTEDGRGVIVATMCPRTAALSTVRVKPTGELIPCFREEIIEALTQTPNFSFEAVSKLIANSSDYPTRVALQVEVSVAVQHTTTLARHVTGWQLPESASPYVHLGRITSQYGASRAMRVNTAVAMYCLVHMAVSVAVGLMAAATGRGLAVWLFSVRVVIDQIGRSSFAGDDCLFTVLAFGGLEQNLEVSQRSIVVAGDAVLFQLQIRQALLVVVMNVVEIGVIVGGWVYGALHAQRFPPTGLVGHGMMWLAFSVSVLLSVRAFFGLKERISQRVIGIFEVMGDDTVSQLVVHQDCTLEIPTITKHSSTQYPILYLVSGILSETENDVEAILSSLRLMRSPTFAQKLEEFAVRECMEYEYDGDRLVSIRTARTKRDDDEKPTWWKFWKQLKKSTDHPKTITADGRRWQRVRRWLKKSTDAPPSKASDTEKNPVQSRHQNKKWTYPFKSLAFCILLIVLSSMTSAAYAYASRIPSWVKMIVEILVSICGVYVATVDRTSALPHLQNFYMSFMVASTVVCAVWYVGVEGVG
ncbi:hypothetical protein AN958_02989 [Leucoagaricus sp. SymC.cos]|nr:hypothetical protein AN958_02989 [Leucoagaricus sp. SymC.cos]